MDNATNDNKLPGPGWYQDPEDATQMRRWDGLQWTNERKSNSEEETASPNVTTRKSPIKGCLSVIGIVVLAIIGISIFGSITNSGNSTNAKASASASQSPNLDDRVSQHKDVVSNLFATVDVMTNAASDNPGLYTGLFADACFKLGQDATDALSIPKLGTKYADKNWAIAMKDFIAASNSCDSGKAQRALDQVNTGALLIQSTFPGWFSRLGY